MKSSVALIRCESYNETEVAAGVQRGIDLLGGMGQFIRPGEKIVLKPNILVGAAPEKLIGPHPLVFQAVARLAQQVTAHLSYGDSSGGLGHPIAHARKAGIHSVAESLGIPLADFEGAREVEFKESPFLKYLTLANGVLDADGLISIAKFKTHALTRITGAVKNQFGCIPGLLKSEFHVKMPNPLDFGRMLVTINLYIRPRLYVMDGIIAMEGNGPRGGTPCPMHVLLFSADPIALDATVCRLIDLNPAFVPTNPPGQEWGLGTYQQSEIELLGDPFESFVNKQFNVVREPVKAVTASANVSFLRNQISPRPVIDPAKCGLCGTCVRMCPVQPKAVDWHTGDKSKPPTYKYERCIRCFCCQELCPDQAISVKKPFLARLAHKL
jgi:uncharacterized protein (DUF362 family)/NAD-dependent dihydropyrimidine dehydrogenase PreA subunit